MEKRMVKRLAAAMLAATVAIGTPMAASATWRTEGKGWNWTVDGKNATGWQMIENTWYYFNSEGTMQTGWVPYGNSWYFLQPSGAMATGWVQDNGKWYYTKADGAMATGWVQTGDTWYCMSSTGEMRTGWVASGDDWYYLAPTGAMVTDAVIKVDDAVYAIAADGSMQTGEVEIAGETYTFGDDGAATGETIPEPDRSFSTTAAPGGAPVETTPTTPPSGNGGSTTTPTTPTKPSRPSYGGGGSTTPEVSAATITAGFVTTGNIFSKDVTTMSVGSYSVSDAGVVSGVAKKVTGYTGFNSAVSAEQEGYYVPLAFALSKPVTAETTITIQKGTEKEKVFTGLSSVVEESDGLTGYVGQFVCVFRLGDSEAITGKTFDIEVDYHDGSIPATKHLTFGGVVKKEEAVGNPTVAALTDDDGAFFENDTKKASDLGNVIASFDATNSKIVVTGTVKKIENWTAFSGDALGTGYYITLKITPAAVPGLTGDQTVTIEGTHPAVGKGNSTSPAEFVYRIGDGSATDSTFDSLGKNVKIDYGTDFGVKTYALDCSGVTIEQAGTPASNPTPQQNVPDDVSDEPIE